MNQIPSQNRDQVTEHLEVLRNYARKTLVHGQNLTRLEQVDKATRLEQFRAIGGSCQLTENEMTRLIFKGLFRGTRFCGCPTCEARRGYQSDNAPDSRNGPRRPHPGQQGPHA